MLLRILLLINFLGCGSLCFSSDSLKITQLGDASLRLVYNKPDSAKTLINEALKLCKDEKSFELFSLTYNYLGIYYDVTSDYDSALIAYNKSIQFAEKAKDLHKVAQAYNNIGLMHWNRGELQQAIEIYFKALQQFETIGSEKGISTVHSNLGLLFYEQKRFDKALDHHNKALKLKKRLMDTIGIGKSLANLGVTYSTMGKSDSSLNHQREALTYFKQSKNFFHIGTGLHDLAVSYNIMTAYDTALALAQSALIYREKVGNKKYLASNYSLLGRIQDNKENYDEAEHYYFKALAIYERFDIQREMYKVYQRLAKLYDKIGAYKKANFYWKKRIVITDSLHSEEKVKKLIEVEAQYETEKARREILERDNELLEKRHQQNMLIAGLIFALILTIAVFLFFRQRIRKNRLDKQQEILEQKLEISRELHDNIGSQLTYINMGLTSAEKLNGDRKYNKLHEIKEFTSKTISDLRTTVWGLNKDVSLEELSTKVAGEISKIKTTSDINIEFSSTLGAEIIPSIIAINLFRIIQEALQNAAKHSQAGEIQVSLGFLDEVFTADIRDTGVGFEEGNFSGFGLSSMHQRATKIGADLQIDSDDGCRVLLTKNMSNDLLPKKV